MRSSRPRRVSPRIAAGGRRWLGLVLLLWLAPTQAYGGACCMSAAAYGVGRLKNWESAAAGTTMTGRTTLGTWLPDGAYSAMVGATARDLRATVWGLLRVHRRGAIWLRVPGQVGFRTASGVDGQLHTQAQAIGDMDAGLRWAWVKVGEELSRPAIATTLGITAPTGRNTARSRDPLGADISGRGAYALTLATTVERTKLPWFVRGALALAVPMGFRRRDTGAWLRYGPSISVNAAAGRELVSGVVASLLLAGTWTGKLTSEGVAVPHSSALTSSATAALAWQAFDDWTLQAAAASALPIAGFGRNRDVQVSLTLGVRYGHHGDNRVVSQVLIPVHSPRVRRAQTRASAPRTRYPSASADVPRTVCNTRERVAVSADSSP